MTLDHMSIRPATLADHPAVERCCHAAFGQWVPLIGMKPLALTADYRAHITRGATYVIDGSSPDELVGVLIFWPVENALYVDTVAVNPAYHKQGIGRYLLTFAEHHARAAGLHKLTLVTNERMLANQAYYRKLGYVETHRESLHVGRVGVWMAKALPAE